MFLLQVLIQFVYINKPVTKKELILFITFSMKWHVFTVTFQELDIIIMMVTYDFILESILTD